MQIDSSPCLVCRKVQCPWCRGAPEPRVDRIIFQWAAAAASQASLLPFITSDRRHRKRGEGCCCWPLAVILKLGAKEPRSAWCSVLGPGSHCGHTWGCWVTVCDFKAAAPNLVASCVDHLDSQHLSQQLLHSTSKIFESSQFYSRSFICFWEDNFWRGYFQLFFVGKLDI